VLLVGGLFGGFQFGGASQLVDGLDGLCFFQSFLGGGNSNIFYFHPYLGK